MGRIGKGYRVRLLRGAWVAEVWTGRRYHSESFPGNRDGQRAAEKHGADQAAKVRAGVVARERFPAATQSVADDYVAELRQLGRSEKHVGEVARQLACLAAAVPDLSANGSQRLVERFLSAPPAAKTGQKLSAATRNRWLVTVRGLCRWAMRHDRLAEDPTRLVRQAQVDRPLPAVFSIAEVRTCLAHVNWDTPRDGSDPRDPYHPLFAVLIYTGFRFQEAARLYWEDIDWEGGAIIVRLREGAVVKRRRERLVPLQAELADILRPWKQDAGPVFAGRCHNPYRGFAAFMGRCGVTLGDRSAHACRHTWASMMAATGVTTDLLRSYLGHGSAATTAIYTQTATRYVQAVEGWRRGALQLQQPPDPGG
jgi:integrase/recombinase XerC